MVSEVLPTIENVDFRETTNITDVPVTPPDKQFIQLELQTDTPVLLSILNLVEILTISTSQVVPMFQLPAWVTGIYNLRGEILWIVDLNHLVGFAPWYQQKNYVSKHTVIVLKERATPAQSENNLTLGLIVNHVGDIIICEPDEISATPDSDAPEAIAPFLAGNWVSTEGNRYWILNGDTILGAMPSNS